MVRIDGDWVIIGESITDHAPSGRSDWPKAAAFKASRGLLSRGGHIGGPS